MDGWMEKERRRKIRRMDVSAGQEDVSVLTKAG